MLLAGQPRPLSWQKLLGGGLSDLAGPISLRAGPAAAEFRRAGAGRRGDRRGAPAISQLEFVQSGDARVRITGQVALADEEFSTVAQGAVDGLIGSVVLITLWLFLAVRTWRLIVPILLTLALGPDADRCCSRRWRSAR